MRTHRVPYRRKIKTHASLTYFAWLKVRRGGEYPRKRIPCGRCRAFVHAAVYGRDGLVDLGPHN